MHGAGGVSGGVPIWQVPLPKPAPPEEELLAGTQLLGKAMYTEGSQ
jgi:hypothetical protein